MTARRGRYPGQLPPQVGGDPLIARGRCEAYDLWGLATGGIAHFKTGFGGREVRYIGAWDLVLDRLGRPVYDAGAARTRCGWRRRRHGLDGGASAAAYEAAE